MAKSTTTSLGMAARVTAWIGAGVALAALLKTSSPASFDLMEVFFATWVMLPWAVTHRLAQGPSPAPVRDGLLVTLGVFWALPYGHFLFPGERFSSTDGVAFVFIPLWHLLCLLVPTGMRLWRRRHRR